MGNHIQFIPGRTLVTLIKSCDGLFPPQLGVLALQLFPTHICLMWGKKKKKKETMLYFMVLYKYCPWSSLFAQWPIGTAWLWLAYS